MSERTWPPPPVRCPRCRQQEGVTIVNGFPAPEAVEAFRRGEAVLGGCVIGPGTPDRHCRACGHEWREGRPLAGRVALVTGVSRRRGIGYAVARRLGDLGAELFLHHYAPHDAGQPWGAEDPEEVVDALRAEIDGPVTIHHASVDLADPAGADGLVERAVSYFGHLDILVCNHAQSGPDGTLEEVDAATLDAHWAVNTRATLLLTRAFAAQHAGRDGGRVVWFTSGQQLGPMPDEIAYATSKAALAGMTASVADWLIERGIVLNTVNPGPVNTGYLDPETTDRPDRLDEIRAHFPTGRFGLPDDPARLVAWLVSDEGRWMVGQVLSSEGGFRRW